MAGNIAYFWHAQPGMLHMQADCSTLEATAVNVYKAKAEVLTCQSGNLHNIMLSSILCM